jgi:hypothetical protein
VTGDLQLEIIESEISALLEKRAIEETQEIGFISSIFTIPKKSGGFRPVINLKALNNFVVYSTHQTIRYTPLFSVHSYGTTYPRKNAITLEPLGLDFFPFGPE